MDANQKKQHATIIELLFAIAFVTGLFVGAAIEGVAKTPITIGLNSIIFYLMLFIVGLIVFFAGYFAASVGDRISQISQHNED